MDPAPRLRHLLEYALVRSALAAVGALPAAAGRPLGRALGRLTGVLVRSRSRRAAENLRLAFPEAGEAAVREWVRRMWSGLGEALWEFCRTPRLTAGSYFDLVEGEGLDSLRASLAGGKGVVLFSAHLTNWEWSSFVMSFSGLPVGAVARRMKNPFMDAYLTRVRSSHGVTVFPHKNAVREGLRWLKAGKILGLLIDQRITAGGVQVPFFGRPAHTTTMAALLAMRTGAALHGLHALRKGGKLHVCIGPPVDLAPFGDDAVKATAFLTAEVESWIRKDPPAWLWMHGRWKP